MKSEFNSLYRKVVNDRCRLVIIELSKLNAKQRLLKVRNLKVISKRKENAVYLNPDRTETSLLKDS